MTPSARTLSFRSCLPCEHPPPSLYRYISVHYIHCRFLDHLSLSLSVYDCFVWICEYLKQDGGTLAPERTRWFRGPGASGSPIEASERTTLSQRPSSVGSVHFCQRAPLCPHSHRNRRRHSLSSLSTYPRTQSSHPTTLTRLSSDPLVPGS